MKIRTGFDIVTESPQPTPTILLLSVHPSREKDIETPQTMHFDPPVPARNYLDGFGNICTRLVAPAGRLRVGADFIVQDTGEPDVVVPSAGQQAVEDLPDAVLVYLLASRYCDTEKLADLAWGLFAGTEPGWPRVQAICDYVHERIAFGYEHARATRTASEGHSEQRGVCRDYAHLAITLCRCMNIPARYATGYLGDIGVPKVDLPMDFSAWFEVYLDGQWYTFDARHNVPRIGRILMARGRDAADVAISTGFGTSTLVQFTVFTDEIVAA